MAFTTEWTYVRQVEYLGSVYHLWSCIHPEGYTAYQVTHQPSGGAGLDFVKPKGSGHYTSLEGLAAKTGISISALRP
jgi:hypothetical protein